jgi:hypothetical protein
MRTLQIGVGFHDEELLCLFACYALKWIMVGQELFLEADAIHTIAQSAAQNSL